MTDGSASFVVPTDHPALAGHFPGNPQVPGVVILDLALATLPQGRRLAGIVSAKFHASLLPGIVCDVRWRDTPGVTHVNCESRGVTIAVAVFKWEISGSGP